MKPSLRSVLVRHIDGPVPIIRDGPYFSCLMQCVNNGWVRLGHPNNHHPMVRPQFSYITEAGRGALCKALAAWAESLIAAQNQRFDADIELEPGVLEPAE